MSTGAKRTHRTLREERKCKPTDRHFLTFHHAVVVELVDTLRSGRSSLRGMRVRVPPTAPKTIQTNGIVFALAGSKPPARLAWDENGRSDVPSRDGTSRNARLGQASTSFNAGEKLFKHSQEAADRLLTFWL